MTFVDEVSRRKDFQILVKHQTGNCIIQGLTDPVEGHGLGSFINAFKEKNVQTKLLNSDDQKTFAVLIVATKCYKTIVNSNPLTHVELSLSYRRRVVGCGWENDPNANTSHHVLDKPFVFRRRSLHKTRT